MRFVSFHSHTGYSYGDGFGKVETHVKRVADLGMSALGISEHGNVNSHAGLEQACKEAGIKPIFGVEAYFAPPKQRSKTHIGLYAMDEEGYRNLNRIITQSYIDSYQYPTVTWDNLRKHNAGIAVLSGCADSFLSCTLLGGKFLGEKREQVTEQDLHMARRKIQRFVDVFGERYYLEVQRFPKLGRTCALNPALAQLSKNTGVRLIATCDSHYPLPTQNKMQKVLHAARRSSSVAIVEASWEYDILLTYPESDEEILNDLKNTGLSESESLQAIQNTQSLAQQCNVILPKARPLRFGLPIGSTTREYTKQKIAQGWKTRVSERPELRRQTESYKKRIQQEFAIIEDKGFLDYFLATADLIKWAKDNDITVGPARGSAAASLICYLLRITEIDPLHPAFDRMVFERFIDPTRSDMPDIDLDFDDELRHKVSERAREIYGKENVASIGNHQSYRGKGALAGIARAYGLPIKTFNAIAKRIDDRTETDDRVDDTIKDVIESYSSNLEVAELCETYPDQLEQAIQLEGNPNTMGVHACGFVIASDPIPEVCAIYTKTKGTGRAQETAQVIPYEKRDAEYLNFLKMDFLGLKAMGMLGLCRKWTGVSLKDLYGMFYWDYEQHSPITRQVMQRFRDDDVIGIFQYEGSTTRSLMRRLVPQTFDHLAAVGALSRPGPYYGGQADAYIAVKNGEAQMQSIHPNFDKHVKWTYGQIVYQEQIMRILRDFAGFDVPTVLRVRKIIGKKLGEHQFASLWEQFRSGCVAHSGLSDEQAGTIWGAITTAAGYAFNIPHAYSYALIAWQQMWFKINHPTEFFAASLAKNGDGKDDLPRRVALLQDTLDHKIKISNWNILSSLENWTPDPMSEDGKAILPGFQQIDDIGEATATDIVDYLEDHSTEDGWATLINVKGIGLGTLDKMLKFVNQSDPFGIHRTEKQLEAFRKQLVNGDFDGLGIPSPEEYYSSNNLPENEHIAFVGLVANIVYRDEIETIRSRTGKSVDEIKASMDFPEKTKKATVFAYDEFGEIALRFSRWRFEPNSQRISQIKSDHHIVVVFGRTYQGKSNAIQVSTIWVFDPD